MARRAGGHACGGRAPNYGSDDFSLWVDQGIDVEIVPHLPRANLDGVTMRSIGGRPVIDLTLC